jgi:mRNA interferase MazF
MGKFVKGDIVVIPFPFSDLSASKRRPALVLVDLPGDDLILCQITSQAVLDFMAIAVDITDVINGTLNAPSNVRPNRLFTADENIVLYGLGKLKDDKMNDVISSIVTMIQS